MQPFLNENFLLSTKTAEALYTKFAANEKIIDYHCHIPPSDIASDRVFRSITEVWLGGDHYKWRLMRAAGVDEELITGGAPDFDKFAAYADVLEKAAGNPLYHWSHLELWRYFGITESLCAKNAKEIWDAANEKLPKLSAREIIKTSGAELLCTTDDPVDTLRFHTQIAEDKDFDIRVLPAFRPDKAFNIEDPGFTEYLDKLSDCANIKLDSYAALCDALCARLGYFAAHGCVTADHGFLYVPYMPADISEIERIYSAKLKGQELPPADVMKYKTALLLFLGEQYARRGFVMQLHFGAMRGVNKDMTRKIGSDTGYDAIHGNTPLSLLADLLDALNEKDALPKTILYSLDPNDNAALMTIAGCFRNVKHGAPWWFNDHYNGMYGHLENMAAAGYLAGFIGMLTDSRSLMSYPRHEYFRRILCAYLGNLVESGQYPCDYDALHAIIKGICYDNAKAFFGF